jgi:hypothetical protein
LENLRGIILSGTVGIDENIELDLKETGMSVWIGFMWLRTGTNGGIL